MGYRHTCKLSFYHLLPSSIDKSSSSFSQVKLQLQQLPQIDYSKMVPCPLQVSSLLCPEQSIITHTLFYPVKCCECPLLLPVHPLLNSLNPPWCLHMPKKRPPSPTTKAVAPLRLASSKPSTTNTGTAK